MERAQERDKKTMNESETDLDQEKQTSRVPVKSPIHASITQSNQEPISGEMKERRGEKVESSTSMGDMDVSYSSKKSAQQQQQAAGETQETSLTKLDVSTKSSRSDDSPESGKNETSSVDLQSDQANEETSKVDKKTLRKGKWAVEEEEYTSRVIQHFSAGLLTLPEGATLRSYLAEKLNCDPMRITKKFTGACCLGRRVYHLRDRPRPSPTELEIAKAERDHLEQRFRMRIEHEQSGLPLSRRLDVLVAQPVGNVSTLFPNQNFTGANSLSPWVQNFATGQVDPFSFQRNIKQGLLPLGQPHLPGLPNAAPHTQSRWLFPGATESVVSSSTPPDPSLQLLNHLVTSWAVAQAAASLPPAALATLATGSIPVAGAVPIANTSRPQHQPSVPVADVQPSKPQKDIHRQLRNAYEEQKKEEEQRQLRAAFEEEKRKEEAKLAAAMAAKKNATSATTSAQEVSKSDEMAARKSLDVSPAGLLQKSYEAHLQALKTMENTKEDCHIPSPSKLSPKVSTDEGHCSISSEVTRPVSNTNKANNGGTENEQPMPDEEAGTVLLGFLNSLRQSFEDAVEKKSTDGREVRTNKPESTSTENLKPSSIAPTSIMKDRPVDWKKKGSKRSPERIPDDNGQPDTMNTLSNAVSQFISAKAGRRSQRPPSVTDVSSGNSSTQHGELSSSLEDSSDKTDPSSSEESEKEDPARKRWQSKGPPRKRAKLFTEKNLIEHSKRMNESGN